MVGRRHGILATVAVLWACAPTGNDAPASEGSTSAMSTDDAAPSSTGALGSSSGDSSEDSGGGGDATTAMDETGSTGEPPSGLPAIGPTMGTMALDFRVAISGTGSLFVGAFEIVDGAGTIEIEGETQPLFVYEEQPWPSQGYTLYQALAVDDDGWTVLWFYCGETGLESIYIESTDGIPLQTMLAEGTCDVQPSGVEVSVDLPGTEFAVLYNGEPFSIAGPEIAVGAGELGEVTIDGVSFVVAPFETVDCSTGCGMPGWYEVHLILWDPVGLRACFAILYFEVEGVVRMTYGMTLPDLVDLVDDTFLDARWSFG